jgi:hypothetical protein
LTTPLPAQYSGFNQYIAFISRQASIENKVATKAFLNGKEKNDVGVNLVQTPSLYY